MNENDETQGAASLQVQLRTEARRCKGLEADLQMQWEMAARKDDTIQQLKENIQRIERLRNEEQKRNTLKTEALMPHVEKLESSVEATGRSYAKLETDIQLLSIMYKGKP